MHFQCWSFYHRSQKYGHIPSTRHHSVSCGQLSAFTSRIKQCIFQRYLFVSFRRTYDGHILSAPSRSSSFMDIDFANIKIHAKQVYSWSWSYHTVAFTSGIKQCIFQRYIFVSFRRTYDGHILSAPSRSSSFMDVDFANIKYLQKGVFMVLIISYG